MARTLLLVTGAVWFVAGLAGIILAAVGTERLEAQLPPLVIDTDALRAAIVAVALALVAVALAHVAVVLGLRAGHRLAWTVGVLMSAMLAAMLVALAAASATSAVADPDRAFAYLVGTLSAGVLALAYGLIAARLVAERRSGSAV